MRYIRILYIHVHTQNKRVKGNSQRLRGEKETETAERRRRERLRISERMKERTPRIVRLQCDVQLAEDYYLSKWQRGKNTERPRKREKERGQQRAKRRGGGGRRGKRHVVNHGPVAPMYYILSLSAEKRACTCYCIVAHNVQSSLRRFLRL